MSNMRNREVRDSEYKEREVDYDEDFSQGIFLKEEWVFMVFR